MLPVPATFRHSPATSNLFDYPVSWNLGILHTMATPNIDNNSSVYCNLLKICLNW